MQQRCEQGHFYDASRYGNCPHCDSADSQPTRPLTDVAPRQQPGGNGSSGDESTQRRKIDDGDAPTQRLSSVTKPEAQKEPAHPVDPVVGWLVCVGGPDRGRDYRIRSQMNFIGRDSSMDICIPSDEKISREKHAVLTYDPRKRTFKLAPAEGRNLTYLNEEAVDTSVPLKAYDKIEIGVSTLMFVPFCGEAFQW